MRCFISLEIPENIRTAIFHLFEKLKESKLVYGKFVHEENMHLTLRFLGKVSEEKITLLKEELSKIDFRQFPVETGKIGFFPNEKHIQILWIELIASEIESLKKEIDKSLTKLGFDKEHRKFYAHLTIARIKGIKNKELFLSKISEIAMKKMFFIAHSFALVKSVLKPRGPEYKLLASFQMRRRI